MPCFTQFKYTASQISIENAELFIEGLIAAGAKVEVIENRIYITGNITEQKHTWSVNGYFDADTKTLTMRDKTQTEAIQRNYMRTVVSDAAARFGWLEQADGDDAVLLTRRSASY